MKEGQAAVIKIHRIKGRRPSMQTKVYVILLCKVSVTCFGFSTKSHHENKTIYTDINNGLMSFT
jgi:hypothetical protein